MQQRPSRLRTFLARFRRPLHSAGRDERGATLIEFGILSPIFFVLIGATLETGMVFLASEVLDSAVQDSTRKILTGQAQSRQMDADGFRSLICDGLYGLFDCNKLQIRVDVISDFRSAQVEPPLDPNDPTRWTLVPSFNPGGASEIVRVRAYYKWPTIVNLLGFTLATQSDNTRLLGAVRVFKNEPF